MATVRQGQSLRALCSCLYCTPTTAHMFHVDYFFILNGMPTILVDCIVAVEGCGAQSTTD